MWQKRFRFEGYGALVRRLQDTGMADQAVKGFPSIELMVILGTKS